jgi:zinc-ribbon domain
MEHPCHKCGQMVEDGVPFCKHCGAPQIRVIGFESATVPPLDSAEAPRVSTMPPPPAFLPRAAGARVVWSRALPGAALGGAFSLLALVIPFAIFGPAFLAGGAIAVMLYRRQTAGALPTTAAGAQIGAASGGFGFLYSAVVAVATLVYSPTELRQAMLDSISQMAGRGYDPQKIAQVQELLKSPQGLTFFVVFALFLMFLITIVGSSIGGALYAAWLRKRNLL